MLNTKPLSLVCRIVRLFFSHDEKTAGLSSRHAESCHSCREYLAASRQLEVRLKAGARSGPQDIPTGLDRRILNAIHYSPPPASPRSFFLGAKPFAATLALLAAAIFLFQRPPSFEVAPASANLSVPANSSPEAVWSQLQPSAGRLLDAAPLQAEADAVYSDARSALGFLAMNFLPNTLAPSRSQDQTP